RVESRKMQLLYRIRPALISAEIIFLVRPIFSETGLQQDDAPFGDLSVLRFPVFYVFSRYQIIAVCRSFIRNIDLDRRTDKLRQRQLVELFAVFGKMHRSVNVRSAVLRSGKV